MSESSLSRLLKEVLIYDNGKGVCQAVADYSGETYDYIWSQTHGRVNPSLKTIKAAFVITKDPRLKKALEPEGFKLNPDQPGDSLLKHFEAEIGDLTVGTGLLLHASREALKDNNLSKQEENDIRRLIEAIKKDLNDVERCVDQMQKKRNIP